MHGATRRRQYGGPGWLLVLLLLGLAAAPLTVAAATLPLALVHPLG